MSNEILAILILASMVVIPAVSIFVISKLMTENNRIVEDQIQKTVRDISSQLSLTRQELAAYIHDSVASLGKSLINTNQATGQMQDKRLDELNLQFTLRGEKLESSVSDRMNNIEKRVSYMSEQSEQRLDSMRATIENRLAALQEDNGNKLEQMRQTVDEKLQKTLNERLSQSFNMVTQQLEQVHKGLGEMQALANGVGDLKRVLSNVKTRGTLGEIQLGAILEQILTSEQYKTNVITRPSTRNPVEYVVVLPGDGINNVLLPIDSKFPMETYAALLDAYETGSQDAVTSAYKNLEKTIKIEAKRIHEKYIEPPFTTDFGIMFLPIEGLYAEVVRHGLVEILQREYKINIAGPTTMAALLNSLQMGFKTLAIQKRSSEVWNVLSGVKTEFANFGKVLESAQNKIKKANEDLDNLIGTRSRAIQRKLNNVELLEITSNEQLPQ